MVGYAGGKSEPRAQCLRSEENALTIDGTDGCARSADGAGAEVPTTVALTGWHRANRLALTLKRARCSVQRSGCGCKVQGAGVLGA